MQTKRQPSVHREAAERAAANSYLARADDALAPRAAKRSCNKTPSPTLRRAASAQPPSGGGGGALGAFMVERRRSSRTTDVRLEDASFISLRRPCFLKRS
mmetsp:Transcript_37992/g.94797  ORF Transcript_37992/g.94797 Transcript_37992/m.94797 type:complete len:100 (+) Transcript_37992:226-525(+)